MPGLQFHTFASLSVPWIRLPVAVGFAVVILAFSVLIVQDRTKGLGNVYMAGLLGILAFCGTTFLANAHAVNREAAAIRARGTLTSTAASHDLLMRVSQHRQTLGFPSVLDPHAPTVPAATALQAVTLHQSLHQNRWTVVAYALAPATWHWTVSQQDITWSRQSPKSAIVGDVSGDLANVTTLWYANTVDRALLYRGRRLSVEILPLAAHQADTVETTVPSLNLPQGSSWATHFRAMALYVLWARP